jgi:hypothetical protein
VKRDCRLNSPFGRNLPQRAEALIGDQKLLVLVVESIEEKGKNR